MLATHTQSVRVSWHLATGSALSWRCWEGDYVVFNSLSGNTHTLDILTGELLKAIDAGTSEFEALCSLAADFLEISNDQRVAETVRTALTNLDDAGLTEPAG